MHEIGSVRLFNHNLMLCFLVRRSEVSSWEIIYFIWNWGSVDLLALTSWRWECLRSESRCTPSGRSHQTNIQNTILMVFTRLQDRLTLHWSRCGWGLHWYQEEWSRWVNFFFLGIFLFYMCTVQACLGSIKDQRVSGVVQGCFLFFLLYFSLSKKNCCR